MSDDTTGGSTEESTERTLDGLMTAVTSNYKILGQLDADNGTAVLGQNDADTGTPVGVKGVVPNTITGYGVATPDDLRMGGDLDTDSEFRVYVDGDRRALIEHDENSGGDAGNVVFGHESNNSGFANAATIAGGGYDDGSTSEPNSASGGFPTIGGGRNNEISNLIDNYGTISGGRDNKISPDGNDTEVATIGGGGGNVARGDTVGSTVSGGTSNTTTATHATVGGGSFNDANATHATIAGGGSTDGSDSTGNVVHSNYGTIGGGGNNQIGFADADPKTSRFATIAGGEQNEASYRWAAVGGGMFNKASGFAATVPGGDENWAEADWSFAAGRYANARPTHAGSFVFGDSSTTQVLSQKADEARFQMEIVAENGIVNNSSRTGKTNVEPVDPEVIRAGIESLDVHWWEYEDGSGEGDGRTHVGPMAEDFHDTFDVGGERTTISSIDRDGVALAAIQDLSAKLDEARTVIDRREARIEELEDRLEGMEERLASLEG